MSAETPDVEPEAPRTAVCALSDPETGIHRSPAQKHRSQVDGPVPSDPKMLAFFEAAPDKPHDVYYCGCVGWD